MICTAEAVQPLLRRYLGRRRRAHSRRVAELVVDLCGLHGLDQRKGTLAGLAHDLAREMPPERVRELALRDGAGESRLEARYPVLLHGRAAATILGDTCGIRDPEIRRAVACHVTGCQGMGRLAKIVFAADFLEPGRRFISERERSEILQMAIDDMTIRVLEKTFGYLRRDGLEIAPSALRLFEELGGSW
jgi:nicotinate-nucleotide adenylyltransferase